METRFGLFNINLWIVALAMALLASCQSSNVHESGGKKAKSSKDKEGSTLRVHLEENSDGSDRNHAVPIYRAQPVMVNIHNDWIVNEADVDEAAVVDAPGGFAGGFSITLRFNKHGTLVLDMASLSHRGSRIAIFSEFGDARWLAAPRITRRITDGVLTFTPDATREEAERIVRGLNNVANELKKKRW